VQGFLAAGHVCTVMGYESYDEFVEQFQLPVVVAGFEPLDLLSGILSCVRQLEDGNCQVENAYGRSVRAEGNVKAREVINEVYEIADSEWRGFGTIEEGGYRLREAFHEYDAMRRFCDLPGEGTEPTTAICVTNSCDAECRSADVLAGRIKPDECHAFATTCTPDAPLGAPMVSSEGACAAFYRYRRQS